MPKEIVIPPLPAGANLVWVVFPNTSPRPVANFGGGLSGLLDEDGWTGPLEVEGTDIAFTTREEALAYFKSSLEQRYKHGVEHVMRYKLPTPPTEGE